ncbi:MAG TPA: alpha/beta hydrolase-fold protein [Pyrinomonadaceae bacterium]|jgi:predicted alpha/beta superfamily hydrolase|nr:alpha/beta hydrolase-fold protein [Pyrinomonadaceae bacterium]
MKRNPIRTHIKISMSFINKHASSRASRMKILLAVLALCALSTDAQAQAPALYDAPARLVVKSKVLGEDRTIVVRTPAGYERDGARYPVLYMTDGDAHIQHTSGTVEFLARNGRVPEMIVVGITNTDRTRDLTPTNVAQTLPNGTTQPTTSGGADNFLKFIETELMPLVESRYRVQPYRLLAGHSLGGLFAIHTMMSRPELFNAYIAVSPSLQWDNQVLVKRAEQFFTGRKEFKKTLFFTLGNEPDPIAAGFKNFGELLARYKPEGFVWESVRLEDEDHGSVVLRSHYMGLRKAFDGWLLAFNQQTGEVVGGLKGAEEHYKNLSQKVGYPVPVPEGLVNRIGYQLVAAGKLEDAIVVFKSNVERYPASANVYDSLGEAYETQGRLDLARPNYEKAYALGKDAKDPNLAIYKANVDRVSEKLKQNGATGSK